MLPQAAWQHSVRIDLVFKGVKPSPILTATAV
jgi:hypothetical protein